MANFGNKTVKIRVSGIKSQRLLARVQALASAQAEFNSAKSAFEQAEKKLKEAEESETTRIAEAEKRFKLTKTALKAAEAMLAKAKGKKADKAAKDVKVAASEVKTADAVLGKQQNLVPFLATELARAESDFQTAKNERGSQRCKLRKALKFWDVKSTADMSRQVTGVLDEEQTALLIDIINTITGADAEENISEAA